MIHSASTQQDTRFTTASAGLGIVQAPASPSRSFLSLRFLAVSRDVSGNRTAATNRCITGPRDA